MAQQGKCEEKYEHSRVSTQQNKNKGTAGVRRKIRAGQAEQGTPYGVRAKQAALTLLRPYFSSYNRCAQKKKKLHAAR